MYWTTKKVITGKKGKEVHKLLGEILSAFIRTREDVGCYALPTEEKVKYDSPKTVPRAAGEDETKKKRNYIRIC